jgi:hypothetical protein
VAFVFTDDGVYVRGSTVVVDMHLLRYGSVLGSFVTREFRLHLPWP